MQRAALRRDAAAFADSRLRFTLVAVPRNELSLERYLDDVRSQLLESDPVSDVSARIATDLRQDGLPVALISYRLGTQMGQMVGYQVAALDATGEQLLIATLVQPEDDGMQLLRGEQREALALAFFKGLTHSQIAETLNQPLGTVKTRIRLAMQKLREALRDGTTA